MSSQTPTHSEKSSFNTNISAIIQRNFCKFYETITSVTNKYDKFLTISIILCMLPTLIAQIYVTMSSDNSQYYSFAHYDFVADWGLTEWLTTYDGGFVRRGLPGEIIKATSLFFEIPPYVVIVLLSVLLFLVVSIWTIRICRNVYPTYLILSPMLLGAPVFAGYLVRKDMLIILMFMFSLNVLISNFRNIIKFFLINMFCVFAILSHELFFFIGFPLLFVIYSLYQHNKFFTFSSVLFFIFPIISVIALFLYKGNVETSWAIVNQWNYVHKLVSPSYCCFDELVAGFGFLTGEFSKHLELNLFYWTNYVHGIFWTPGIWICLWLICGFFIVKFIQTYNRGNETSFISLYVFQTICAIPLFIVAIDHGRWIVLIAFLSIYAITVLKGVVSFPSLRIYHKIHKWNNPLQLWHKIAIILFFGIPHLWVAWTLQVHAMPIMDLLLYLWFIITGVHFFA